MQKSASFFVFFPSPTPHQGEGCRKKNNHIFSELPFLFRKKTLNLRPIIIHNYKCRMRFARTRPAVKD